MSAQAESQGQGSHMDLNLNSLKRHIFFEFINIAKRAFILVRYSEDVVLGRRGFTEDEKENGIILVFNDRMNFQWDDYGLTATLVFGTSPQKCFIPADDIIAVSSPELNAQFVTSPSPSQPQIVSSQISSQKGYETHLSKQAIQAKQVKQEQKGLKDKKQTGHVIEVDFTKKRK
jgi:hypothetical protein